jgi:hypothetical protein
MFSTLTYRCKVISSLAIVFVLFSSCDNNLEVIGDWKEIPIVYGVFSPDPDSIGNEKVNLFRIEKAFLDPNTSAFEIAQRPDSLYYGPNDLRVIIYERKEFDLNYVALDTLERVDALARFGISRDNGIFASTPNWVYMMERLPTGSTDNRYYKMVIENLVNGKTYTNFCRGITMGSYNATDQYFTDFNVILPFRNPARPLRWAHVDPASNEWIFDKITVNWSQPSNAAMYDVTVILNYEEFQVDVNATGEPEIPGTRVSKKIAWKAIRNFNAQGETRLFAPFTNNPNDFYYLFTKGNGSSVTQDLNGENFFTFLSTNLSNVSGTNIRRCAGKIDFRIDAAGPELARYISAINANQNLIGGLFPADPFTNIESGFGLFSFKFDVIKKNYTIEQETFNYLNQGDITRNLGFKSSGCQ